MKTKEDEKFFLAIDGGQSSTSCLIGLADGTILSSGLGSSAAVPNAILSENLIRSAIQTSISSALKDIDPNPVMIEVAYLSLTGAIESAINILPAVIPVKTIKAESDSKAALACGTYGGPGVVIISGTGCISYAKNSKGKEVTCGGWGYLLGDEGSGFWIGLQAIRAAISVQDGKKTASSLTLSVLESLKITDMREAQEKIYNDRILRPEIARLAPKVMSLAEAGDEEANRIIDQAVDELFSLLRGTCLLAGLTQNEEKVIVATGGILRNNTVVFSRLSKRIQNEFQDYRLVNPFFPPVVGAYLLGLQQGGVKITDEILSNINNSLSKIQFKEMNTKES